MNNNSANWVGKENRAEKAKAFVEELRQLCPSSIQHSIENTSIYDGATGRPCQWYDNPLRPEEETPVQLLQTTTDGALSSLGLGNTDKKRTAVLNFASYKNAGGAFLMGAMAQEEALCHTSTLYPVLLAFDKTYYEENRHNLNKGLYTNKALYSKDIIFFDKMGAKHKADVITCASPNNSIALRDEALFTKEENEQAMIDRIKYVRDICLNEKTQNVILGAWGCGVFAQDPFFVATEFRKAFETTGINCIYAIPDDKNFEAFKSAFAEYDKKREQLIKDKEEQEFEER